MTNKGVTRSRFYVDSEPNDDNAIAEAMAHACVLAKGESRRCKIVFLSHTLSNTAWFQRLIGESQAKELVNGIELPEFNAHLKTESLKTFKNNADIVVTCALDDKELLNLESTSSARVIIAVPWQKKGLEKWLSTYQPTDLRTNRPASSSPEPNCIIKTALKNLTNLVNISNGINHPSDRETAKTYVRTLHKYEDTIDPNVVRTYLIAKLGWAPNHADDVVKLFETLNAGKFFQGGERTGLQKIYKRWKDACK